MKFSDLLSDLWFPLPVTARRAHERQTEQDIIQQLVDAGFSEGEALNLYKSNYKGQWEKHPIKSFFSSDFGNDLKQLAYDLTEFERIKNLIGSPPDVLNRQNILDSANEELLSLYNDMARDNNSAFNNYADQIQSNLMQSQNAVAGATRYELDRTQRTAIERGATAAQRLVANVNAQLGLQNNAATQALETNNQLAQQLLAQRNANTQLRQQYIDRKQSYAENAWNSAKETYDYNYNNWERASNNYASSNPIATQYINQKNNETYLRSKNTQYNKGY